MEASDHAAVADALAPDVVLYSPIIGPTFRGREAVGALFVGVLENIEDLRYTDELEGAETHALAFRASFGKREAIPGECPVLLLRRNTRAGRLASGEGAAPGQRLAQRDLVGVLEVGPDGEPAG
jgi:SnoaL-like domain